MNAPFKQDARMGRLSTTLGKDVLNLQTFRGDEHVNGLFTYKIEALADSGSISFDKLIGTNATVHLTSFDLPEVPFDGIITDAELIGEGDRGWRYAFTLRPWLWLMGLRRKQQIYHDKTVVDILDEVFAPYGRDVINKLTGAYPTLEYTVQYRESDLAFACRMMERFGISYHFAHDDGAHALVLTDNITAHDDLPGATRPFLKVKDHRADAEHLWDLRPSQRLTTGKIRLTDYNFKAPDAAMETDRAGEAPYEQGEIESYDYPGDFLDQGTGKKVARLRIDQERGQDPRHRATGDCASLRAGMCVKITGETVQGVARALCLGAQHSYTAGGYGTDSGTGEASYEGQYLMMPDAAPLRPERKTPRAVVQGPQTAKVVGEGEIDCDEFGRILVRFHWDLDDRYSMRCRVSQNWAAKGWGGMVIPRIGMEVVVEFLEGDPDNPLVTGCVYNGKNDVPYPLPAHKTKSVFRSDTHKGSGFNEFTFEDEKGQENISLHAQKDQTLKVLNNRMKRVDNDQTESVGANKSIDVGQNHQEKIGGSMNLTVGGGGFGGALGLTGMMAGLLGSGASAMAAGAAEVADGGLSKLVGGLVAGAIGGEAASAANHSGFAAAGQNAAQAGKLQAAAGTALGAAVAKIMPVSGIMNTVVEKAKSDTIGMARTEQIGLLKNTFVGQVQNTTVGKAQFTTVGETQQATIGKLKKTTVGDEYVIEVGKSKLVMKSDGTVLLKGVRFNFEASGPVTVLGKVIDLN